jgi:GT2 family glycosyltransferase
MYSEEGGMATMKPNPFDFPSLKSPVIDISVIIVTWNSAAFIEGCLRSIYECTSNTSFEIIVVDNGSADETVRIITTNFRNAILLETRCNLGFARACNMGIRLSSGRLIFLLNPDACFKSNVIDLLRSFLDSDSEIGAVGPKVMEADGSVNIFSAREFPTLSGTFYRMVGLAKLFPSSRIFCKDTLPHWDRNDTREVPSLTGVAMMIPKSVFTELGLLDETIPMYFEDLDICARIRAAGKAIFCVPEATILHQGGGSADLSPTRSILYQMENGQAPWLYFKRYGGRGSAHFFTTIVLLGSAIRLMIFGFAYSFIRLFKRGQLQNHAICILKSASLVSWSLLSKKAFAHRLRGSFTLGELPPVSAQLETASHASSDASTQRYLENIPN